MTCERIRSSEAEQLLWRVSARLTTQGWVASLIGAIIVFFSIGFILQLFFDADERDALGLANLPIISGSVIAFGVAMTWILKRRQHQALGWLREGRDPDEREYRQTLKLPAFTALITAVGWTLGAVVGGLLNLDHSLEAALVIGSAVLVAGETTSALAYLLSERTLRPITALALAAQAPERAVAPGVRDRMLSAWSLGTGAPLLGVLAVGVVGLTKENVDAEAVAAAVIFLGAVASAVGLLVTVVTARAIADPLTSVRAAVERVAAGDLDTKVAIDDSSEVGLLQAGFNRMAEGLRERERIRDMFGRHVGVDVARAAMRDGARLGGEEREIGALFVDLAGSTSMALAMPPTEVVRLLNRFFRVVNEVVESEGGWVNKFEGDAALCVFGAPVAGADPAGSALRVARVLAERLERDVPEIGFGIGVSAGRAVAGNVGAESRFEYTVIGDPVNEAARLCDLAKQRQEPLVASDAALRRASDDEAEAWDVSERTVLRGRLEATGLALPRAG